MLNLMFIQFLLKEGFVKFFKVPPMDYRSHFINLIACAVEFVNSVLFLEILTACHLPRLCNQFQNCVIKENGKKNIHISHCFLF